jgi:hypothetical protein
MSEVPGYTGPAHPLSCPIAPLTAVNTTEFNHRAVGIRNSESAFHLAGTILGGRDIIEEFVLPGFGRFSAVGLPSRSYISTSTG